MYRPIKKKIDPSKAIVLFDFDNTIASLDTFDDIILNYSINDRWKEIEEEWKNGLIGSRKCLEEQLKGVRISKKELDTYLKAIKIDPYFKKLLAFLRSKKIKALILSDNFDKILKPILKYNKIQGLRVYCNKLRISGNRLIPVFPFQNPKCRQCGHCKEKNVLANTSIESIIFYIGDGRSDICPALQADFVFAKDSLLNYFCDIGLKCTPFKSLKTVYNELVRRVA
jgi:2-hydroxy-3-keto-5-methylthiopentenyl-1-phosphate phosphatase